MMKRFVQNVIAICCLSALSVLFGCARPAPSDKTANYEAAPYTRQAYDALEAKLANSDIDSNKAENEQQRFNMYVQMYKEAYRNQGYDFEKSIIKLKTDSEADYFNQTACYFPRCALTVRHLCLALASPNNNIDIHQTLSQQAADAVLWYCGRNYNVRPVVSDDNVKSTLP